jgi:hypothetical protein
LATGCHPGRQNDLVPQGSDVLDGLTIHQVRGAFHLDDGLVGADGVVAVLEVEAEGDIGRMLEEDIADGAVNDVVDGRALYKRPSGQRPDGVNMNKYKPGGRYSPLQKRGDCCNERG